MYPVTHNSALSVGLLTADVAFTGWTGALSPVQPVLLLSFATVTALHRYLAPVTTVVTSAEELLLGCLTCSLMHDMVLAPVHHLGTTGASGGT